MALAKRAEYDFQDRLGGGYRIRIWEEGYVGSAETLIAAGEGFTLEYQPDTNDIASFLVPSTLTLYIINNSDDVDTLISDIIEKQQKDWYVEILRGTNTYTPYWRGIILQDEISEIDMGKPRVVSIKATDGLARLEAVDYDFANTVAAVVQKPEHTPILSILNKIFQETLDNSLWGATDDWLVTSVDFWDVSQSYSSTADPLKDLVIDVLGFRDVEIRKGAELFNGAYGPDVMQVEYLTCVDILKQLAQIFVCRVYQYNGAWHFEQIPLRADATTKRMRYVKAMTTPTYSKPNTFTTIDQSSTKARLAQNRETFIPALARVEVEQTAFSSDFNNLLILLTNNTSNTASRNFGLYSDEYVLNSVGGTVGQALFFELEFLNGIQRKNIDSNSTDCLVQGGGTLTNAYTSRVRPKVNVTIKLDDAYSATTYYWNGTSWQTSVTSVTIYGNIDNKIQGTAGTSGQIHDVPVGRFGTRRFNTTYLPATGIVTITLGTYRIQYYAGLYTGTWSDLSNTDLDNLVGGITIRAKTLLDRAESIMLYAVNTPNTEVADYEVYKYPNLFITDKSIQSGHILIDTGSFLLPTYEWSQGTNGEDLPLPMLMIQKRLAIQSEPIKKYDGSIIFNQGYGEGVAFDGVRWLWHDYTFDANSVIASGVLYEIGVYSTLGNPTEDPSFSGIVSRQAFRQVPTGQEVEAIIEKIEGIESDGGGGHAIGNLRLTKEIYKATILIDASASGSSTLGTDVYWIKLSWSGGNGTYVLNMNALIEGQEYKIYADSTITASTIVALTPDTENINGSTEYNIDGVGIYHVVAIDGEWVIYQ